MAFVVSDWFTLGKGLIWLCCKNESIFWFSWYIFIWNGICIPKRKESLLVYYVQTEIDRTGATVKMLVKVKEAGISKITLYI